MTALVVLAKTPRPGRVKTRLCPPLTPHAAARFAAAALDDTLDLVDGGLWSARVLALDLPSSDWDRPGWIRVTQCTGGLDVRLGHALEQAQRASPTAPVLLIGMDTPHLHPDDLAAARELLDSHDAVLGPAEDGGFWAIGLRRADARLIQGVPMSSQETAAIQLVRFREAGLSAAIAATYRDIDTIDDARRASRLAADSRFAAELTRAGAA